MKLKNSLIKEILSKSSLNESVIDTFFNKNIDITINRWLELQKIIKENQSLEKIIEKQHTENFNEMKKYFHTFYNLKLKTRILFNDIKYLKARTESEDETNEKEYYLTEASGIYFGNALAPLKNIISVIRDNYDYIPILVSLIDEEDTKQEVESLAEFFCNQFYTNILIPNPEQEELLICIYKLLEYEINKMDFANVDNFLEDSTFIGKLISAFTKQQELNSFIVNLLSKVFNDIDRSPDFIFSLSLDEIMNYLKNKRISEKGENNMNKKAQSESTPTRLTLCLTLKEFNLSEIESDETVFYKIPKTKINFKKKKVLEEEIFRDTTLSDNELNINMLYEDDDEFYLEENEDNGCNTDYRQELTEEILNQKIKSSTNPDLIAFYNQLINELSETYHNSDAFGNQTFVMTLDQDDYKKYKKQIIKLYFKIFLFIQEQVEEIIQSLIDKITTIPYAARCICTMIDILITRKFPSLPKYFRHSFIGKFLFSKCIFPVLSLENTNGLKTNLFTKYQVNCLKYIISVISNANMCKLFDIYNDVEKTMFNYYLLEIIPVLNKFYDELVNMTLPNQLNKFIEQSSNSSNIKEESSFLFTEDNSENKEKKESQININNIDNNKKNTYDYFKENSDEIFRLKSVCFNEEDTIFITSLLNKNIDAFKNLPNFSRVKMALKERDIRDLAEIIFKQKDNREKKNLENTVGKGYYTFFYNEDNNLIKDFQNTIKLDNGKDKSLLFRMKNSIKTILRRLNVLNLKQYSYLNFATSNEKFFLAINYTLKDLEGDIFNNNKIPLNWHSKFIVNNLNQLAQKYIENDYEKLYEEIYSEENELLNKLKSLSPIINARETMNLNCAENAIENLEYQINNLEKAKKLEKVKIFINNDKTKVYVDINNEQAEISRTKSRIEKSKSNINLNQETIIRLKNADKSYQTLFKIYDGVENNSDKKIIFHAEGINDFIFKLKKSQGKVFEYLRNLINNDIQIGKANHKIYMLFEDYKNILNNRLIVDYKDFIKEKNEAKEILNKIEDYILQRTYKYIFPLNPLDEDKSFFELTKSYDWIPATYFGIKKDLPQESIQDSISYMKQMEDKAFSINEKMKYFRMILSNINKINEFYLGVSGKTADDQTPIYAYIILKSHPKRFISNIYYVKCFTDGKTEKEPDIQLFKDNSLICVTKILEITPESLNLTSEEFSKKKSDAKKRLSNLN